MGQQVIFLVFVIAVLAVHVKKAEIMRDEIPARTKNTSQANQPTRCHAHTPASILLSSDVIILRPTSKLHDVVAAMTIWINMQLHPRSYFFCQLGRNFRSPKEFLIAGQAWGGHPAIIHVQSILCNKVK